MYFINFPVFRANQIEDDESAAESTQPLTIPGLKLGQAANILLGFRAGWIAKDSSTSPFFSVEKNPLPTKDVKVKTDKKVLWDAPRITLHKDTNALLNAVFPYGVQSITGDNTTFSAPSGPLMTGNTDGNQALEQLSDYLGVNLISGYSYMLVELVRTVGSASHNYLPGDGGSAEDHLKPDALAAIDSLTDVNPRGNLTKSEAIAFMEGFETMGTHYVSKVTAGDRIFQVFAYKDTAYDQLTHAFNKNAAGKGYVEGVNALAFQFYTTPRSSDTGVDLGYASDLGKVKIVSEDSDFQSSVKAGSWKDSQRAHGDSIFVAYQVGTKVDLSSFQSVVPIDFELTPMGNLISVNKCPRGRRYWDRLLKGALLQKYGQQVRVTFPQENSYQWKDLLPNSGTWLSTIATPTVNAYDGHVSLAQIQLTNRDVVKTFSSWSVVLESGASKTEIPGENVSLSSYLIDTSGPDEPPEIELANQSAFNGISLACGHMDGALIIGYTGGSERKTVMDGILLESSEPVANTGRRSVKVVGDLFGERDVDMLQLHESDINYSIVTCQTLLYSRGDTAFHAQELARDCLLWLTDIIPNEESTPQSLSAIRLRAAYLGNVARRIDEEGITVPYLEYGSYKDYIQAMSAAANELNKNILNYQGQIENQKLAELQAKTAEEINDNVKTTGNLLRNYIDSVAINQGDIATNYENIMATKQRELTSALENFSKLVQAVDDQKEAVNDAKLDFERAMVEYETTEIIKAVINISTAFVTVGIAIATPSATISALKDLGETAQKIQKLITVLNKIMDLEKTIEGTVKDVVAVNRTLDAVKNTTLDMPTSMEWSEMSINFDASLASTPSAVAGDKAKFVAAFKILVLRAQAMLSAQSKIAQLNADIALNKAQKKINEDQQKRLKKIISNLHYGDTSKAPNLSEIDLLSLTGHVQSQLNQVLASLAQALVLQDSAVQFELLAQPTSITKFDLSSLLLVMTSQQANIIAAKQAFNPPPFKVNDPIEVVIKGVPISEFTGGNTYEFQIQPSISEFQPYNMVRIQQVLVDIPAIKNSKNGKYRIDLSCEGNPFEDRSPLGESMMFNTVARHFGPFEYRSKDHSPVFGDQTGSIGSDITHITPFSTWQVNMPELDVNEDIDFGSDLTVDIVLSFKIEALAEVALYKFCEQQGTSVKSLSNDQLVKALKLMKRNLKTAQFKSANVPLEADAEPSGGATTDDMLSQMYKAQGVLKGWDCVLNMLEDPVNKFLAAQYKEKYPTAKPMVVDIAFCQPSPSPIPQFPGTFLNYTKVSINLGQPLLEFQANNHNYVKVTQVIQSGSTQKGSKYVKKEHASCPYPLNLEDPEIKWDDKEKIDVSTNPTVTGAVALGKVQGLVTPKLPDGSQGDAQSAHSVILDFTKGSFIAKDLNIDTDNAQFNMELSNWFTTNPINYLINTVVFNDATTLKSLQPSKFKLNVLTTNSKKNILQVFITTNGQQKDNLTINVNEPIPDGYHNSLMINTKIMFEDIFVKSFNKGSSNLQVESVNPKDDYTAWCSKVKSGSVSGEAKFDNTSDSETRINSDGNTITWPLDGLLFERTKDMGISLKYDAKKTVNFQHRDYICSSSQYGTYCSWSSWRDYSVEVDVTLTGNYPLVVDDKGGKQEVQIASTPPNVAVTPPDLKPTGPCECNDNDLKIQVGDILKKQVPEKLKDSMAGITFGSVSVFALYNLLFPTEDFIEMKTAYIPGDLVVLGTFNKYVSDK